jgi:hypothetical protein
VPGERYQKDTALVEKKIRVFKTCLGCSKLRNEIHSVFGQLAVDVKESYGVNIFLGRNK